MKLPVIIAIAFVLAGCRTGSEPKLFERLSSAKTGITFANMLQEDDSVYNPLNFDYMYNGAGVAAGDFNNDGLQDVYFAGNMVSNRLYLNQGNLKFKDATEAAGVGTKVWSTGVTLVDINQDGLLDIYVSVAGLVPEEQRGNLLFVNQGPDKNGTPRFVEQAKQYGIADTGYSTHAVFLDYDRDGDLDLYVLTNALEQVSRNNIRPKYRDGQAASTDRLYRNNGNGTFTNVSREAGILIEGYGLGVAVSDLNKDGWPDIYVSNDFLTNDIVWINNQDGTFSDRAAQYLKHQTYNGMGTDVADYNNDGLPDIVVVDMLPADNQRKKMMLSAANYDVFHMALNLGYLPQYMRNTLQLNNGPGPDGVPSFSEVGQLAGVHETDWSWAPLLADFDNDGLKDLFISNGYRRDVTNLDFITYSRPTSMGEQKREVRRKELHKALKELPEVKISNYVFQNKGDLTFANRSADWGVSIPSYSTGALYADLDNDGDLDLVVNNIDDEALVYENRADKLKNRNHLRVALKGPRGNAQAYGAKVVLHSRGGGQYQEMSPYRGYKSTVENVLHFGLGAAPKVDSLEVYWPDGTYQLLTDVQANRVVAVDHRNAVQRAPAPQDRPGYLFQNAAVVGGLNVRHQARDVADFKLTPLLPHKHSKNGPGIAVGDVDGNGYDDVYIGSDRGQPKEILLQVAPGRFEKRALEGDTEYQDMGALFLDANGDGHSDLYVVSGGSFGSGMAESYVYQDRLYLNDGRGNLRRAPEALPKISSSGSSVVAADYDGDGDLDLFVGGRIEPGKYPLAPRSYLLRNDSRPGGAARFTDVTETVAPDLARVGLVTSALWTDFDQDGKTDLVVVGEWMPITFFKNDKGRFTDATSSTGLGATNGWWNSVAGGDFDNDGDIDYVVGNLGLNSKYRASAKEPVRVHAADFDGNGSIDPILSYYINGKDYPAHSRDAMIDQMIGMKGRFARYSDFAGASMKQTLSRKERKSAYVAQSVNLASSYVENLGGGRFAVRPLPLGAQFAPTFGMLVDDCNGDGNLDVLLVGNSYAADTQTGWYDAAVGGVLLGNGKGGFQYLSGSKSGFYVDGDAKSIAKIRVDDSRSYVLVTQNNDSLKVFSAASPRAGRSVKLQPSDAYAVLTFAGGRQRRQELYHGSAYLSQSSRYLTVPQNGASARIYDSQGKVREYKN